MKFDYDKHFYTTLKRISKFFVIIIILFSSFLICLDKERKLGKDYGKDIKYNLPERFKFEKLDKNDKQKIYLRKLLEYKFTK